MSNIFPKQPSKLLNILYIMNSIDVHIPIPNERSSSKKSNGTSDVRIGVKIKSYG